MDVIDRFVSIWYAHAAGATGFRFRKLHREGNVITWAWPSMLAVPSVGETVYFHLASAKRPGWKHKSPARVLQVDPGAETRVTVALLDFDADGHSTF